MIGWLGQAHAEHAEEWQGMYLGERGSLASEVRHREQSASWVPGGGSVS